MGANPRGKEEAPKLACGCMLSCFSHVWLFVTPCTRAHQAPLSIGFSRPEYWTGLPFPPAGDLPDPGVKPMSLTSSALTGRFFTTSATWEAEFIMREVISTQHSSRCEPVKFPFTSTALVSFLLLAHFLPHPGHLCSLDPRESFIVLYFCWSQMSALPPRSWFLLNNFDVL